MATMIKVRAGNGRLTPLHPSWAGGTGVRFLRHDDEPIEVERSNTSVQRALRNGDLVIVDEPTIAKLTTITE